MRKASLRMFLLAALFLPAMAAAEEVQLQLVQADDETLAQAPGACGTPDLAAIFDPKGPAEQKATYNSTSKSGCCSMFGCCTHVQSGCETCSGGRRWYSIYSCGGGWYCKAAPTSCPTPC